MHHHLKAIFERYIQLADVLGQMFSPLLEIVVHDFTDLDHSIIHIVNGHISGRQIGGAASELGIRRLLKQEAIPDVLVNYANKNHQGQRLKSASMAIRDDQGNMIGAFCLNFDVSQFEHFQKFINFFISYEDNALVGPSDINDKHLSNEEEIENEIKTYLLKNGLISTQLTYKDKQAIVNYLQQQGCLKKRGAISAIANSLKLTRQCIYNYLELAKNNH
jgi:predicted transcriptional regulator YheO